MLRRLPPGCLPRPPRPPRPSRLLAPPPNPRPGPPRPPTLLLSPIIQPGVGAVAAGSVALVTTLSILLLGWAWPLSIVEFATSFSRCSARSPYAVGVRCTGSPLFHTERPPELTRSARSVSSLPLYIYYSLPTTADHKLTECNKQRQTISTLPTISGMLFAYMLLFTFSLLYHFCCSLVVCCLLMICC